MNNYMCPLCNSVHDSQQWDDRTKLEYNEDEKLTSIKDESTMTCFFCPTCGEESEFGFGDSYIQNINNEKVVEYITITKCEYDELIESKQMSERYKQLI